jgi:hypothetical protein
LLDKINPQHPLQSDRRPAPFTLRIKRGKALHQPRQSLPRKAGGTTVFISARNLSRRVRFFLAPVFCLGKAPLMLHQSAPDPNTRQSLLNPLPKAGILQMGYRGSGEVGWRWQWQFFTLTLETRSGQAGQTSKEKELP